MQKNIQIFDVVILNNGNKAIILGKENRIAELMPTAKASFQVLEGTKVRINTETSAPLLEVFE